MLTTTPFDPGGVAQETRDANQMVIDNTVALPHDAVALRAQLAEMAAQMMPDGIYQAPGVRTIAVGGPAGPVPVRVLDGTVDGPVIVHLHGGGWMFGSADMADAHLEAFRDATGLTVASVEYRLSPEDRHPAGADDVQAVVEHLAAGGDELGTGGVVLLGESAGANLALVTLLALRDAGKGDLVPRAALSYGMYDLTLTPSARAWGEGRGAIDTPILQWLASQYVDDPAQLTDWRVSPLYGALHDLPPVLLTVGTEDPLLDDTLFLHARLLAAGATPELQVLPGGMHAFDLLPFPLEITREATGRIASFLGGASG